MPYGESEPGVQVNALSEMIKVEGLVKYFPVTQSILDSLLNREAEMVKAVDSIDLTIKEGEIFGLVGESGCGKTTTGRVILRLIDPTGGHIWYKGVDLAELSTKEVKEYRKDIQIIFQDPFESLNPKMTIYELVAEPLEIHGIGDSDDERQKIVSDALIDVQLIPPEDFLFRYPHELSGGQRQRVAIGRAIVRKPRLFLFDEPLSNLDATLRNAMRIELAALHRNLGITIIYVTHDQIEAMTLGQKVILLNEGNIQQVGTPDDVYNRPSNVFVAGFVGSPQINFIKGRITRLEDALFFASPGLSFKLSGKDPFSKYVDKEITLGIRPEALVPGDGPLSGRIEFIENLGAETILHAISSDTPFIAKAPSDFSTRPGEMVTFALKEKGLHFFYQDRNILTEEGMPKIHF